jgi:hypothetical protein
MRERDFRPTPVAIAVDVGRKCYCAPRPERGSAARRCSRFALLGWSVGLSVGYAELCRESAGGRRPTGGYSEEIGQSAGARLGSRSLANFE